MQDTNGDKNLACDCMAAVGLRAEATDAADQTAWPAERGAREARIACIITAIDTGFSDRKFSTRTLAGRLGLSVRYVQDLMKDSGVGVTERILEQRLRKAHAILVGDHGYTMKISDIAAACGFNEVSHFHRCFRRRFGTTPARLRIGAAVE